jgi:hypothetical protein
MVTPDDVVVPEMEVEEVVEEVISTPSRSRASTPTSEYDAVWKSEVEASAPIGLMVYNFSGINELGQRVGPFKVVAPNLATAADLVGVGMPVLHRANAFDEGFE